MISLSDFFMRPSGGYLLVVVEDLEQTPETRISGPTRPNPRTTDREINCPSAGKSVSAYRGMGMSASTQLPDDAGPLGHSTTPLLTVSPLKLDQC